MTYTPDQKADLVAFVRSGASVEEAAAAVGCLAATAKKWLKKYEGVSVDDIRIGPQSNTVRIMAELIRRHAGPRVDEFEWARSEIEEVARAIGVPVPKNMGDTIYAIRHARIELPQGIRELAPAGKHWLLLPHGKGKYKFALGRHYVLAEDPQKASIKIPDATPELIRNFAGRDEQAVLARLRYNRLIDIFLGITAFGLQSHMRTTVSALGRSQIETDEIYIGVSKTAAQFVIPVQAKGPGEKIGAVQIIQDEAYCREKYPSLIRRMVAAKCIRTEPHYVVAIVELTVDGYDVYKAREEHYELVPYSAIDAAELNAYRDAQEAGDAPLLRSDRSTVDGPPRID